MSDREADFREITVHPDGKKEGPINDSLSNAGAKMGVRLNKLDEIDHQEKNPYDIPLKTDPDMKRFEELMGGK